MIVTPGSPVNSGYAGTNAPVVQNLGPGDLYVYNSDVNVTTEGLLLPPFAVYEFPEVIVEGPGAIWFQALGGNCDVRVMNVG